MRFKRTIPKKFIRERKKNKYQEFLTQLDEKQIADSCKEIRLSTDKKTGYCITTDNELINVFNNGKKGRGKKAIIDAKKRGAKKLNCFDGFLTNLYKELGFKEIERIKFNDNYAPKNWDYTVYRRPDIVLLNV